MKYTKQQRTDIANAFKAAKAVLNDGRRIALTNFICNALEQSGVDGWKEAQYIVSARIHPHSTFRNWIDDDVKGGISQEDGHPRVQAHRHAWLDQLIEEFSV